MLDVTISSNLILDEVLGIKDLRSDKRIDFVGGIRGLGELKKRVDSGEMKVALALYPVSMKQLMDIADTGNIMPPKTTWFEPKLRSGLVIHKLDYNYYLKKKNEDVPFDGHSRFFLRMMLVISFSHPSVEQVEQRDCNKYQHRECRYLNVVRFQVLRRSEGLPDDITKVSG